MSGTPIALRDRQQCLYRAIALNTWSGFSGFGAFYFVEQGTLAYQPQVGFLLWYYRGRLADIFGA